jgi:hypothetical protein
MPLVGAKIAFAHHEVTADMTVGVAVRSESLPIMSK